MIEALGMIEVALLTWAMGYLILFPIALPRRTRTPALATALDRS
jgi:hypothetical protein